MFLLGILLMLLLRPQPAPAPEDKDIPPDLSRPTGTLTTGGDQGFNVRSADRTEPPPAPAPEAPAEPDQRQNVRRIASAFAERFGSFSNQGDFENIVDLEAFMSARMVTWARRYVEEAREARTGGEDYFGITTRSISSDMDAFDEAAGTATVKVNTQRQERKGVSLSPEVYYQEIVIEFVTENGIWKVDSAEWTPRD